VPADPCEHSEEEGEPVHDSEGRFVYSDGSNHPCCLRHVREFRGLAHGPGTFMPYLEAP
jgi:hypothetical protein